MKKICATMLLLCLTFGVQVWATEKVDAPSASQEADAEAPAPQEQMPARGQMPPRGERPQGQMSPQGQMPVEQRAEQSVETAMPEQSEVTENRNETSAEEPGGAEAGGMPRMMGRDETTPESVGAWDFLKIYATSVVSVVLLMGSFVFVKLYKRKMY